MPDSARFCGSCGATAGSPANSGPNLTVAPEPLDYEIVGDNLQIARVRLRPGQEVYSVTEHRGAVLWVGFSPCGRRLASTSEQGPLTIRDGTPLASVPERD